jgi:DNA primase
MVALERALLEHPYVTDVELWINNDKAGRESIHAALSVLKSRGYNASAPSLSLPEGFDNNDLLRDYRKKHKSI